MYEANYKKPLRQKINISIGLIRTGVGTKLFVLEVRKSQRHFM
jgi:hypothetical protein